MLEHASMGNSNSGIISMATGAIMPPLICQLIMIDFVLWDSRTATGQPHLSYRFRGQPTVTNLLLLNSCSPSQR